MHRLHNYTFFCGYLGENRMLLDNTVALVSVLAILLNSAGWLLEERTGSTTVQALH